MSTDKDIAIDFVDFVQIKRFFGFVYQTHEFNIYVIIVSDIDNLWSLSGNFDE
jgi:hypothetical protein